MTGPDVAAILVDVGLTIFDRAAPKGLALIRSQFKGRRLIIVGPPRAGKTTFIDYLQYGIFEDEKETSKTLQADPRARFDVALGRDGALQLIVRGAVDVPGQYGPIWHADRIFYSSPHAILLILDLTAPLEGADADDDSASAVWLTQFCQRLEAQWRAKGKRGNRTKSMIILMNKADKVEASVLTTHRQRYKQIVNAELREARGKMLDEIAVLPCALVTNPNGTKLADAVITHLARALVR